MHYQRWRNHGDPLVSHAKIPAACSVPGCGKPARGYGWCSAHYGRWRAHGDPLAGRVPNGEPMRFFEEVVLKHDRDECLQWPYAKFATGYAELARGTRKERVSRLVCEHFHGPAPSPGHVAAHTCGKGHEACVAPRHLVWKTEVGNHADKLVHGTSYRGSRHHHSTLTEDQVRAIRRLFGKMKQQDIAKKFHVTAAAISGIKCGRAWAWLE